MSTRLKYAVQKPEWYWRAWWHRLLREQGEAIPAEGDALTDKQIHLREVAKGRRAP